MRKSLLYINFVASVLCILFAGSAAAYTITSIGFLSLGDRSEAYGLDNNASVKVVGMTRKVAADVTSKQAFVWDESGGNMYELSTLATYTYSVAYDINDSGLIVGESWDEDHHQACIWDATGYPSIGAPVALPKLLAWHTNTMAYAINGNAKVVGISGSTAVMRRACIWDVSDLGNITVTDLGALPGTGTETGSGYSTAYGISENDIVSGYSFLYDTAEPYSANRGCFWNASNLTSITMAEIGYISSSYKNSYGRAIYYNSSSGNVKIAGDSSDASNNTQAATWDTATPTTTTTIGYIPSETSMFVRSYGVVDDVSGTTVVGKDYRQSPTPKIWRAFIWNSVSGTVRILYDEITTGQASWSTLFEARGINDAGKIVGYGENISGNNEAFILVP